MVNTVIIIKSLGVNIAMYEFITTPHIQIALIIGILLAVGAAFLSPFLVLNGEAMIADGLAHTSFLGFAIGLILVDSPLWIALIVVVIATLIIKVLVNKLKANADSAIGIISALSFAIGLIVIHKTSGVNVSIESLMAGSILTSNSNDIIITAGVVSVIIIFVILTYRKLFSVVYDFEYAQFSKIKAELISYVLAILTAVFIVVGVRVIGTLLISALIIFPAFISSILGISFKNTFITGIIISVSAMLIGITASHFLDVPTGAFVVVVNTIILILVYVLNAVRKRVKI